MITKRFLALITAVCMVLLYPVHVYAEEAIDPESEVSLGVSAELQLAAMAAPVTTFAELQTAIANATDGATIEIGRNIVMTSAINLNKSIKLEASEGNGEVKLYSASGQRHFLIEGGDIYFATQNVVLDGSGISGGISATASHLHFSAIVRNCYNGNTIPDGNFGGAGINASKSITIYGGEISNCFAYYGAAVRADDITLDGGEVFSNSGSPAIWTRQLIMNDGKIYDNVALGYGFGGGGVYAFQSFTMNGGSIYNNSAIEDGGGVWADTIIINDGEIYNNSAGRWGGGLYGQIHINGGEIYENEAQCGGGIFAYGLVMEDGKIYNNNATLDGGGIYQQSNTSDFPVSIYGGSITNNQTDRNGGGIYCRLVRLTIRGNTLVKDNIASQARYMNDSEHIAQHIRLIDSSVSWTDGFDYIYNNYDVVYTTGSTEPPLLDSYTVILTEKWEDATQADVVTPYTVNTGESAVLSFTTPEGYEAVIEASDKYTVDYTAGTITIGSVNEDLDILVLYRKLSSSDTYTVTVVETYADGSQADNTTEHTVAKNAGFYTVLTVPSGYDMSAHTDDAALNVNAGSGALHIASVTQNVLITVTYTPNGDHAITIVERYEDGAAPEKIETYTVAHGDPFYQELEVLEGYTISVVGVYSNTGVIVDVTNKAVSIDSVERDYRIELSYYIPEELDEVTLTNLVKEADYANVNSSVWKLSPLPAVVSLSSSDGVMSLEFDTSSSVYYTTIRQDLTLIGDHKYYVRSSMYFDESTFEGATTLSPRMYLGSSLVVDSRHNPSGWSTLSAVSNPETNGVNRFQQMFRVGPTADYNGGLMQCTEPMVIDLTEAFGAGNEPTVEWCDDNIPFFEGTETITI